MQYTTNFHLTKPTEDDFYGIEDYSDNIEIIDTEIKKAGDLRQRVKVTLKADNWHDATELTGGTTRYLDSFYQDVSVSGMTADKMPFVEEAEFEGEVKAYMIKQYRKVTGRIFKIETGQDTVRVFLHSSMPAEDFSIMLRGDI